MSVRVVVVDDQLLMRQALKSFLGRIPDIEVVGEASNGWAALRCVRELRPDVLILDIEMPEMDGIEVARQLCSERADVKILIFSANPVCVGNLRESGISDYLVKGDDPCKLVEAVFRLGQNKEGVSGSFQSKVVNIADH